MKNLEFIKANFDIPLCDCFATGFLSETHRCSQHPPSKWQWYHDQHGHWRCSPRIWCPEETWWQTRKNKSKWRGRGKEDGKVEGKSYESRSPASKAQRSAISHITVPMTQDHQLAPPRFAFKSECEKYEYIACFMEEWRHQASITPWTLSLGAPDPTQREFEPQLDGQAHRASITSWNPNPEAFDFVPGVFIAPSIIEPRARMERMEDEKAGFETAQAACEVEICSQYEANLHLDSMPQPWAPPLYYYCPYCY
ncbi:MAG: hypothetical protein LQ349_003181 [Xanthoria aureola]|nr:MAG: hypothetical protein LQ349_003181 [Xanthoria aureola]